MIDSDSSTRLDDDHLESVGGSGTFAQLPSDPPSRNTSAALARGRYWQRTGWNPTLGTIWGGVADLARQAVGAPELEIPQPSGSNGSTSGVGARHDAPR